MSNFQVLNGTAGEHIVCADLISEGHKAFLSSAGLPYDVIADVDGKLIRVAVKSTLMARPRFGRTLTRPCYQFSICRRCGKSRYTKEDVDLVALVALDRRIVAYLECTKCPSSLHLDEPGVDMEYPNKKGPKRGKCKTFIDFTLSAAIRGMQ